LATYSEPAVVHHNLFMSMRSLTARRKPFAVLLRWPVNNERMIVRATRRTSQWTRAVAENRLSTKAPTRIDPAVPHRRFFFSFDYTIITKRHDRSYPSANHLRELGAPALPKLNLTRGVAGRRAFASAPFVIWPRPFASTEVASWPTSTPPPDLRRHRSRKRYYSASKRKPRYGCAQTLIVRMYRRFLLAESAICALFTPFSVGATTRDSPIGQNRCRRCVNRKTLQVM